MACARHNLAISHRCASLGNSTLVLSLVHMYRSPRNPKLVSLYRKARAFADDVAVASWAHHLRAYNRWQSLLRPLRWIPRHRLKFMHQPIGPSPLTSRITFSTTFLNGLGHQSMSPVDQLTPHSLQNARARASMARHLLNRRVVLVPVTP